MKCHILIFIILLLCATDAISGDIFGKVTIEEQDNQDAINEAKITANVTIECNGKEYSNKFNIPGSYKIKTDEKGRCSFNLGFKEHLLSSEVILKEKPKKYDFKIKKNNDGDWIIVRD